jgi:hypothetical protein
MKFMTCGSVYFFCKFLKFMQGDSSCSMHPFSQSFPRTEPYPRPAVPGGKQHDTVQELSK